MLFFGSIVDVCNQQALQGGKTAMKRNAKLFLVVVGMFVWGCTSQPSPDEKTLVTINEFHLKSSEFQRLLAMDMERDRDFKLTDASKMAYLNEIIQKEVLIQEAKRLKLDRKANFIRTIERYWEATLIRNLMELRGAEIEQRIVVSQTEIRGHYDELKQKSQGLAPLVDIEKDLINEIKEAKKTAMFKTWVDELRGDAKVQINNELLRQF
jgi:hypothetical protein